MKITIDQQSGFCFGVVYAIQLAEQILDNGDDLYCLGDIVHNDLEIERLDKKGLKIIDHDAFQKLQDCNVLIRAHGEPPETYKTALRNKIRLIDASCPVVLKLQNRVKNSFDESKDDDGQVLVYGKAGHAEVNGLLGQTNSKALVISSPLDLEKVDFSKPITLFSQTTKSTDGFYELKELIEQTAAKASNFKVYTNDTICRQVSKREPSLRLFSKQHDVIIFVAGRKSSNGKVLFKVCSELNKHAYFISFPDEIKSHWFEGFESVGICGATSTPRWLMESIASTIRTLT